MEDNNNHEGKMNTTEEESFAEEISTSELKEEAQNNPDLSFDATDSMDEFTDNTVNSSNSLHSETEALSFSEEQIPLENNSNPLENQPLSSENQSEPLRDETLNIDEESSHPDDQLLSINEEITPHPDNQTSMYEQNLENKNEDLHPIGEAVENEIKNDIHTPETTNEHNSNEQNYEEHNTMSNSLRDTIFGEEDTDKAALAEINFDLVDAGRWLLKVIAGPNNGAEFSMHSASSYVIGTDPTSCDIVFHDTSVSRQHARISLAADEGMTIEDLKSRNQTLVDGEPIKTKVKLMPNSVVTVGTTSFTVYDREGEMQTIISPLLPAIVKVLKEEPAKTEAPPPPVAPVEMPKASEAPQTDEAATETPKIQVPASKAPEKAAHAVGTFIVLGIIAALFGIIALGVNGLFRNEPVVIEHEAHPLEIIQETLKPFPSVTPWFNKSTGNLQLMGHVTTAADKTRLMWSLKALPFVSTIDDKDVIIDEFVWQEANQILSKNPVWKSISIQSPSPGKFILTGYLQTRSQADQLSEYVASIFPYLDLLEKRITVEEDVVNKANNILSESGFRNISIKMEARTLTLTGGYPPEKEENLLNTLEELRKIPGVLDVKNLTTKLAPEQSIINISDKYEVTGFSKSGANYSVVIHGRILTKGDELDGMQITEIRHNAIMLERDGVKYRIDFSR